MLNGVRLCFNSSFIILHSSLFFSASQLGADLFVDALAVHVLARQLGHSRLHHLADVFCAESSRIGRGGLGNRRGHRRINLLLARRRGHVTFHHLHFGFLL